MSDNNIENIVNDVICNSKYFDCNGDAISENLFYESRIDYFYILQYNTVLNKYILNNIRSFLNDRYTIFLLNGFIYFAIPYYSVLSKFILLWKLYVSMNRWNIYLDVNKPFSWCDNALRYLELYEFDKCKTNKISNYLYNNQILLRTKAYSCYVLVDISFAVFDVHKIFMIININIYPSIITITGVKKNFFRNMICWPAGI